jgi:rRNA-processing protein FCF1
LQREDEIQNSGMASPSFEEEAEIPAGSQDDVALVRLAVESGATLVTTDGPLKEALSSSGIQEKYTLQILSPDEGLKIL